MIPHHRHIFLGLLLTALFSVSSSFFTSCSEEHDAYPNVITELADIHTDAEGKTVKLELDYGKIFDITNPMIVEQTEHTFRVLVSFIPQDDKATLYSSQGAYILSDSTETPKTDPTKVLSVWRTQRYINLHLAPLTQGGVQHWGIITDSIVGEHRYLHLHHNQNNDPTSYTTDVYASLPLEGNERITLRAETFEGTKTFEL